MGQVLGDFSRLLLQPPAPSLSDLFVVPVDCSWELCILKDRSWGYCPSQLCCAVLLCVLVELSPVCELGFQNSSSQNHLEWKLESLI